jgi:hypothetical protein
MYFCDCWLPWKFRLSCCCLDTDLHNRYVVSGSIPSKAPTSSHSEGWCLGEVYRKMDMLPRACTLDRCGRCWYVRRCFGWCCGGSRFWDSVSVVVLTEFLSRAQGVLCFVFPGQDLVGAAVRRFQGPASWVLSEEEICAVGEVLVYEGTWSAWHVAETGWRRIICWRNCVMRYAGSTGCLVGVSSLAGHPQGFSVHEFGYWRL